MRYGEGRKVEQHSGHSISHYHGEGETNNASRYRGNSNSGSVYLRHAMNNCGGVKCHKDIVGSYAHCLGDHVAASGEDHNCNVEEDHDESSAFADNSAKKDLHSRLSRAEYRGHYCSLDYEDNGDCNHYACHNSNNTESANIYLRDGYYYSTSTLSGISSSVFTNNGSYSVSLGSVILNETNTLLRCSNRFSDATNAVNIESLSSNILNNNTCYGSNGTNRCVPDEDVFVDALEFFTST